MSNSAQQIQTEIVPFHKLTLWDRNVRKTYPEKDIAALAENIASVGLLQNLLVVRLPRGRFGVAGGGRRYRALQVLVEAGRIKRTHPVPCGIASEQTDAEELSLAENVLREDMHPADKFEAFQRQFEAGRSAAEIAARFGTDEKTVVKMLALARVNPALMQEYRDNAITLETLQAFTLTDDFEQQAAVWASLQPWQRRSSNAASTVRSMLSRDEVIATDKRVQFVGLAAYEKAGGSVRRDLFATESGEGAYIQNPTLLNELVASRLNKLGEEENQKGWKWVELQLTRDHQMFSRCKRLHPEAKALTDKQEEKLAALKEEKARLESDLYGSEETTEDPSDEMDLDDFTEHEERDSTQQQQDEPNDNDPRWERLEKVEDQIAALEQKRKYEYSDETKAISGVVIAVDHEGHAQYTYGLLRREDEAAIAKQRQAEPGAALGEADVSKDLATDEEQPNCSYSASLIEDLTRQKTAALAIELARNPQIALAATVHTLIQSEFRVELDTYRWDSSVQVGVTHTGFQSIESAPAVQELVKERIQWLNTLRGKDLWQWCIQQDQATLMRLLAFCVSQTINAVQSKGESSDHRRLQHANRLGIALNVDVRRWFTPTAETVFSRLPKAAILAALKEARCDAGPDADKCKKAELAELAERQISKTGWLPGVLRITVEPEAQ